MDAPQKINLFLVDDHQMVLDGLMSLLQTFPRANICGYTNNALEVIGRIENYSVDILITDIQMPGLSGIELTKLVKSKYPNVKVICISMLGNKFIISEMIKAGVSGFILKSTGKEELINAITQVYEGNNYFSQDITKEMMSTFGDNSEAGRLTNREIEIIKLIEKELSNKQIADKLFISERTVETHRKNIFRKTGTQNIVGLIKFAYREQII
ncbi:response regulator transcription factor [Pedobacter sp. SD-b]|uniref:Response regulator transcription factor n=1 Tax=Pedobacter segetis TaxID=2793069 RepID=A0ABS1BMZ2_9SPHI|nr:response regulator transcription factor [Pedobacter segetis]MBK0384250.1 response regulator transcription factor [Pedobacter segetis]